MSPDDEQTRAEGRTVHPLYEARIARLAALAAAMPTGMTGSITDEDALAIEAALARVQRGRR